MKYKSILITGGTGSFGKYFLSKLIKSKIKFNRIVIYSRDELKQFELNNLFSTKKHPFIRYFIGDIRDKDRLSTAMNGIDCVVHAAALKQIPSTEYNPFEAIKTNIIGAQNVIECAIKNNVKKVIALSTDKAAAPINLYGATKLCSDKLFVSANNIVGSQKLSFSVVRYGNVFGSRGSVVPYFLEKLKKDGYLPITDIKMTRFNISLNEGIDFVINCIKESIGGEIFVPILKSYRIKDLANAIQNKCKLKIVGIRPGEKIHEEMITTSDSFNTYKLKNHYVILPQGNDNLKNFYLNKKRAKPVKIGFNYNSLDNQNFLSEHELRKMIKNFLGSSRNGN